MEFVSNSMIRLDRELSELDRFALEFVRILKKHTRYVIISGYVAILLGRARVSEDIDIIIPRMGEQPFLALLAELKKKRFYCLNAVEDEEVFDYIKDNFAVRFAREGEVIPNIELKFAKKRSDDISLDETIRVVMGKDELIISNLEIQIAFKERVLKSDKDMEDAQHLRNVARGHLNLDKIREYERLLHGVY